MCIDKAARTSIRWCNHCAVANQLHTAALSHFMIIGVFCSSCLPAVLPLSLEQWMDLRGTPPLIVFS